MAISDFSPGTFFTHATEFASQGRGVFLIPKQPKIDTGGWPVAISQGILAKGFHIPGRQLGTYPEFSYVGPTTKHAYGLIFPDIDVEFLLMGQTADDARAIYNTFCNWVHNIAGPERPGDPDSATARDPFSAYYYNEYVTDAFGTIYSQSGEVIVNVKFLELYPVSIGQIATSWESPDAPISFTVTFTYFYATVFSAPQS